MILAVFQKTVKDGLDPNLVPLCL